MGNLGGAAGGSAGLGGVGIGGVAGSRASTVVAYKQSQKAELHEQKMLLITTVVVSWVVHLIVIHCICLAVLLWR